ncbi:hypothetical protein GGI07_000133 [Coemansia sp. Benny D115]|nr:hypothetical protein GGI07_000133 [Coemansia sp. Benny D115]
MSQSMGRAWLANIFGARSLQLDVRSPRVGRQAQIITITHDPTEPKHQVFCEISDKKHYIRAALSKKALRTLETRSHQPVDSLRGAVIEVNYFIPKLYIPAKHTESKQCPRNVRGNSATQFWMVITNLSYVGGEGNDTFDEPEFLATNRHVLMRLDEHTSGLKKPVDKDSDVAVESEPEENNTAARPADTAVMELDHAAPQADPNASDSETGPARKKRRQSLHAPLPPELDALLEMPIVSPQQQLSLSLSESLPDHLLPPLPEDLPFIADAESAWSCADFWNHIRILGACTPLMPVFGDGALQPQKNPTRDPQPERGSNPLLPHPSQARIPPVRTLQINRSAHLPARNQNPIPGPVAAVDTEDALCFDSNEMIESMFGDIFSSPSRELDESAAMETDAGAAAAATVSSGLSESHNQGGDTGSAAGGYWDQDPSLVIHTATSGKHGGCEKRSEWQTKEGSSMAA